MMNKLTYSDIEPYIAKGLVAMRVHPDYPNLSIFNYTKVCQYEGEWDDITMQCRGLIIDMETGEHLSKPFKKFFNYGEHTDNELPIPDEEPVITEKIDGWLGILYWYDNLPWIATRGSFDSIGAIWATQWIREDEQKEPLEKLSKKNTYLFEIISPVSRIVVDYMGFAGLIHLATMPLQCEDIDKDEVLFARTATHKSIDIDNLDNEVSENREGFVLHYPVADLRLKIKFDEYIRLHKIMTGMSTIGIWETLKKKGINATVTDVVSDSVPDECYRWVEKEIAAMQLKYSAIEALTDSTLDSINVAEKEAGRMLTQKEKASIIIKQPYSGIAFAKLANKEYTQMIFKHIRPNGKNTLI